MPKMHRPCSNEEEEFIRQVLGKYHQRLVCAEVKVGVFFTRASRNSFGEIESPAIICRGSPAYAVTRLTSPKERVFVPYDAIIEIDEDQWSDYLSEEQRVALVDHELTHLEIIRKNGEIELCSDSRPKLRLQNYDWQSTGFLEVLSRHRENSLELQDLNNVLDAVSACVEEGETSEQSTS